MPQLTIKVLNGEVVRKGLENIRADIPKIARSRLRKFAETIVRKMRVYPPKPAGSKYVRTFKLQRSWKIKEAGETGYRIEANPITRGRGYGVYVVGDAMGNRQAGQNSHWQVFRNVVDEELEGLPKSLQGDIGLTIKRRGFG